MTDNKPYPAPPVALRHIYKFTAPLSGEPIWRPAANMWNGQAAQESVGLYTLAQMNAHADATCAMRAAQPDTLTYPNPIDIFAAMTAQARGRTSPENVVDVLFALHAAGMRNGAAQAARGISKSQKRTAQRMHHMNTNTNAASVPGPEDQKFNAWYESKFKPAMERGPLDKYVARQAWFAAISTAAQPPAGICVPTELAERVQETMGEFLMDHGWRQQDMDTSDEFGALLAAAATQPHPAASQDEDSEATNQWRRLALQFDGHRMLALSHLRLLLAHGEDHKKTAQEFVSAPPLAGEEVLKQRIATLATQAPQPSVAAGEVVSANTQYATIKWERQTSLKGGGDPENSYSWPITGDKVYLAPQPQEAAPEFTRVAKGKLDSLIAEGYEINGYSFEKMQSDGSAKHGFVTCGGLVGWWYPHTQAAPASQDAERFRAIIQAAIDDDDVFQTTMNQDRFKDIETLDDARRMVDAAICASSAARAQAKEGST